MRRWFRKISRFASAWSSSIHLILQGEIDPQNMWVLACNDQKLKAKNRESVGDSTSRRLQSLSSCISVFFFCYFLKTYAGVVSNPHCRNLVGVGYHFKACDVNYKKCVFYEKNAILEKIKICKLGFIKTKFFKLAFPNFMINLCNSTIWGLIGAL